MAKVSARIRTSSTYQALSVGTASQHLTQQEMCVGSSPAYNWRNPESVAWPLISCGHVFISALNQVRNEPDAGADQRSAADGATQAMGVTVNPQ
jgi:hypothetical protein